MCCPQIFSFNQKPSEDKEDDDDDLSDSNDSVYSGLEDSGSESDDDDDDKEEDEQASDGDDDDDDDDDVKAESKLDEQVRLNLYLSTVVAIIFLYITNVLHYPQGEAEEGRLNKGGEKNNDEYDRDSSDEEVR